MKLKREDSKWLDELFRKHQQDVFRTCLRFAAGDREWALDRSQEVFVTLAQSLGKLGELEDLGGWLYRVSVNACLMELRREKGWRRIVNNWMAHEPEHVPSAESQVQARKDVSELELALKSLPTTERALMVLVYLDGKSQSEAAKQLGFSKGYVSKLHKRALARLESMDWEVGGA